MADAGALVIGQMGGPTAVVNASLAGVIHAAQQYPHFTAIYGMVQGVEGLLNNCLLDLSAIDGRQLLLLKQTPGAALGSSRHKVTGDDYARMVDVLRSRHVRYLALIGGNGTMTVCQRLSELAGDELRVIGIPKTIDNDLAETHFSPGYPSAARFLALATRDTGLDLEAMTTFDDVVILETFGRNTGWLAASSALLKEREDDAPHLVYVPEIPFDEARFLDDVKRVHSRLSRCFIVVAEGIKDARGDFVGLQNAGKDALGRVIHSFSSGVAVYLSELVREKLGLRVRFLRPNLIGRVSSESISMIDRHNAWLCGCSAVEAFLHNHTKKMLTLKERIPTERFYTRRISLTPLDRVAGIEKSLPREYMDDAGTMIAQPFRDYALPLIGAVAPVARLL